MSNKEAVLTNKIMTMRGNIEPVKANAEEFASYSERVEHLFKVNAVQDDMKLSMFITLAGLSMYCTLKNLVVPKIPIDCTYAEVTGLLKKHFLPPVAETYERFVFSVTRKMNKV